MTAIERSLSILAVVLIVACVALIVVGENVLGLTSLMLSGGFYAYATTPHDGDERLH